MKHADRIAADPRTLALDRTPEGILLTLRNGWAVDGIHVGLFNDIRDASQWLRRATPSDLRGPMPDLVGWTCTVPALRGHDRHAWRAIIIEQHDQAVVVRCLTEGFTTDRWTDVRLCRRFLTREATAPTQPEPYML